MFKPLANRVLVLPAQKEDSINGIFLPDQSKTNPPTYSASNNSLKTKKKKELIRLLFLFSH